MCVIGMLGCTYEGSWCGGCAGCFVHAGEDSMLVGLGGDVQEGVERGLARLQGHTRGPRECLCERARAGAGYEMRCGSGQIVCVCV